MAASVYLGWMNWRLSRVIVSKPWRHPVEIVSALHGADAEPIARQRGGGEKRGKEKKGRD